MSSEALLGIGPRLAAAREASGMSTAEVAAKLRLGLRQVEALEADAFEQLPGEVFVRGFVRNYARLLELDPEALLPNQEVVVAEQLTVPSTNVRFQPSPLQRWLLLPAGGAILFFALVALLYAWLSSGEQAVLEQPIQEEAQAVQPLVPVPVPVPAEESAAPADSAAPTAEVAAAPQVAEAPADKPASAPLPPANRPSIVDMSKSAVPPMAAPTTLPQAVAASASAQAVAKPAPAVAKPFAPVSAKPVPPAIEPPKTAAPIAPKLLAAPATAVSPPAPAKPAASNKLANAHKLVFQPAEDSWIQVIDASGQRFSKLIRAGSSESLNGVPPFRMVIGNAATMRLSHDGKTIDLKPFIGERVARLKLGEEGASRMAPPDAGNRLPAGQDQ